MTDAITTKGHQELWDAVEEHRAEFRTFRESVNSRLRALEGSSADYDEMLHGIVDRLDGPRVFDILGVEQGRNTEEGLTWMTRENQRLLSEVLAELRKDRTVSLTTSDRVALWVAVIGAIGFVLAAALGLIG